MYEIGNIQKICRCIPVFEKVSNERILAHNIYIFAIYWLMRLLDAKKIRFIQVTKNDEPTTTMGIKIVNSSYKAFVIYMHMDYDTIVIYRK